MVMGCNCFTYYSSTMIEKLEAIIEVKVHLVLFTHPYCQEKTITHILSPVNDLVLDFDRISTLSLPKCVGGTDLEPTTSQVPWWCNIGQYCLNLILWEGICCFENSFMNKICFHCLANIVDIMWFFRWVHITLIKIQIIVLFYDGLSREPFLMSTL